jgi:hypothetical protein
MPGEGVCQNFKEERRMPGNYYLIRYENKLYANNELYINAIAKGKNALIRLLSNKAAFQ